MEAIKAVLFDLDGTLLPLDQDEFIKGYFGLLAKALAEHIPPQRLTPAMLAGVDAMLKNDGSVINEEAFWRAFTAVHGEDVSDKMPIFEAFYRDGFLSAKAICGYDPKAAEAVKRIKAAGYTVALATSPVFPMVATEARMQWAGLEREDFALVTSYENSRFCKPSAGYYREVAAALDVSPKACLMVGNDMVDDMEAEKTGMKVFLLTDHLLNRENRDISPYPQGGFDDLLRYLSL